MYVYTYTWLYFILGLCTYIYKYNLIYLPNILIALHKYFLAKYKLFRILQKIK